MDLQNEKCVMVIDETLPTGLIANTAGIMGITLGKEMPDTVGPDVTDKTGCSHRGIIQFPVPILKADGARQNTGAPETALPAGIRGTDCGGFLRHGTELQDLR